MICALKTHDNEEIGTARSTIDPMGYIDLIKRRVKYFRRRYPSLEYDDLFQAGFLGLLEACRRFNGNIGDGSPAHFYYYASRNVDGRIMDYVIFKRYRIHIPKSAMESPGPWHDAAERLYSTKFHQESEWRFFGVEERTSITNDEILSVDTRDLIDSMIDRVSPRVASVIVLRFGLNGHEPMSYPEIAHELKISVQQVARYLASGLDRIRYLFADAPVR